MQDIVVIFLKFSVKNSILSVNGSFKPFRGTYEIVQIC
jgi:hypothetical protein